MSVSMMAQAFAYAVEHELAPTRRLVLYVMADVADDDGRLWPGQKRLQRLTGLSVSTIRQSLREFEDAGILDTTTRVRDEGRGRTSNLYVLTIHAPGAGDRWHEQPPPAGDRSCDQPPGVGGGSADGRRTNRRESAGLYIEEPSENHQGKPTTTAGAIIRALDRVAFARQLPSPNPETVAAACAQYADRDLPGEAEAFAHYWTDGPGAKRSLRDVGWSWRSWLKRAEPRTAHRTTAAAARASVTDDLRRLEEEAAEARAAEGAAA